jgi:glycosyltransferase involved in cell wall biosynthesis
MREKISGLAIVYNEEKNIQELIENLHFVDELVIVDSFSTDETVAIIRSYPQVKLIQNPFVDYTSQRMLALENASYNWILFLDADERITPQLRQEILDTVANPAANDCYYFYRQFMFEKRKLYFSGLQTDKNFRLFKKDKVHFIQERLVHETLEVMGSIGHMKNKLLHYSYVDYASYKNKAVAYGKLRAQELLQKNKRPTFYHLYLKPTYNFLYNYFVRLGILDGKKGIIICYLNAFAVYSRYQALNVLLQKNNS